MDKNIIKNQNGAIALITLMVISVFALAVMTTMSVLATSELKMSGSELASEKTFYAAEAGINEALYRLIANPVPQPFSLNLDGADVQVTVSANPANPYQRIIQSQATDATSKVRTLQIIANTSSFAGGFDYAVQGGNGGIYLDNNSVIDGKIYSNSSILPASGGATGNVTGEVWVAGANSINKVRIGGNAHAHSIIRSTISGQAYYQSIDSSSRVGGAACPNNNCHPSSPDPEPKPLPISDTDVQHWKDEISNSGNPVLTANPAQCPTAHATGTYCIHQSDAILGLQKIDADFYVGNGKTLTLTGNLWVTGKIFLDNNGTIKLHDSLGAGSAVIIADGIIDVNNNYTMSGSGDPRSFLLILSTNPSVDVNAPAIYASNNSVSIIFAAIHGMLKVKNNGALNAAAAELLYLEPNSTVTYNPNIAGFTIPSGGGDTVGTALGTWQEK